MKKVLIGIAILFGFTGLSRALSFDDPAVSVVYSTQSVTTDTSTIIIDLSDTTNWPHKKTNWIKITSAWIDVNKAAASSGTVSVGIVTAINTSSGTVNYFIRKDMSKGTVEKNLDVEWIYDNEYIELHTSSGDTTKLFTNLKNENSSSYKSESTLPAVSGTDVAPAVGDVIFDFDNVGSNAWNITLGINYTTK